MSTKKNNDYTPGTSNEYTPGTRSTRNDYTPSSSSYLPGICDLTSRQPLYKPFRIKITPASKPGISTPNGKSQNTTIFKPVLIKDLFPKSSQKERQRPLTSSSVSNKKKFSFRTQDSFLSTQSCGKPKSNTEPSYFTRKPSGISNVRRQLYQESLDVTKSHHDVNVTKVEKVQKRTTKSMAVNPSSYNQNGTSRKSSILPPNSIREYHAKKSAKKVIPEDRKQRNSTIFNNQNNKTARDKAKTVLNTTLTYAQSRVPKKANTMVVNKYNSKLKTNTTTKFKDNSTMTSPLMEIKFNTNTISTLDKFKSLSLPKLLVNAESSSDGIQIEENPRDKGLFKQLLQDAISQTTTHVASLRKSIDEAESQLHLLNSLYRMLDEKTAGCKECATNTSFDDENKSPVDTCIANNLIEKKNITIRDNSTLQCLPQKVNGTDMDSALKSIAQVKPTLPIKIFIDEQDSSENDSKSDISKSQELARLSTIGEESCELEKDDSRKDKLMFSEDDKENLNSSNTFVSPKISKVLRTPKSLRRKSVSKVIEQPLRRSERLSAKYLTVQRSPNDIDNSSDSFITLENELNVERNQSIAQTPQIVRPLSSIQDIENCDEKIKRPLKEYMDLKLNGTFLVTPDVAKFQSRLELNETPHSRKSLSRKIFNELCDLYADSPEHNIKECTTEAN